jgi:hypothetical protein
MFFLYGSICVERRRSDEHRFEDKELTKTLTGMKKLFTFFLLLMGLGAIAQPFNNEWIDYSKTYYKFKIGANGLVRIPQSTLAAAGLGGVPAEQLQLFRNGQEVPIYVTNGTGVMGGGDYVEFWGQMNDGVPDKPLYRNPAYQHTTRWSLESDTAVYFLTVNPTGNAFHFSNTANNVAGSPLSPEPYFLYTAGSYFKSVINPGFAGVVGEYIYSSSYDIGEFWGTGAIAPGAPYSDAKTNLSVYAGGPDAVIKFGLAGTADNPRTVQVSVNGTVVGDTTMNSLNDLLTTRPVPLSIIASGSSTVNFINNSPTGSDRMVASFYELTYSRQFNFGGQENFPFQLPARASGYLLNITNLAGSSATPVMYDLTNGLRYTGVVSGGTVSFALNGSTAAMQLVLVNENPSLVQTVGALTAKTFENFTNTANQGNFIIISSPLLYTGSSGNNPVTDYKNYRSSVAGGAFDAQTYDIDELVDQFAFGVKKHPLSIQNFLRYARAKFTVKPQYCLLIGHGMTYDQYYSYSNLSHDPLADRLNIIPTFGSPASDNKLAADDGVGAVPVTPIGRLSVVSGPEVEVYLAKLKEYEQAQATAPNTIAGRLWMKNYLHLTGVSEPYLGTIICNYMGYYASIVADTLVGATTTTLCDGNAGQVSQTPGNIIGGLFSQGLGVLNYFGHSSNDVLAYNLNDPYDYNNQGKYPVFLINGCDAGDFYVYDAQRVTSGTDLTISEKYVLAKERGAIAFVASTNFGIVNYLNILLAGQYTLMTGSDYGKPLGIQEKDALINLINAVPGDFFARLHAEQMTIHGDPAIKLGQEPTDYDVEASQVVINPSFIAISNQTFEVKARLYNLGKAVSDSVLVQVKRTYPDGSSTILFNKKIRGIRYSDSIDIQVPIVATRDKGDNKITVSINPNNEIPEVTYANNSATTDVYIYQDEATPVYPYNYAIINTSSCKLIASTANALAPSAQYIMQLDTTQAFNSPLMVSKTLNSVGGVLEFDPGVTYLDSVVYYWRVGIASATGNGQVTWDNASFIYIDPAHSGTGFNQSHYFQHLGSTGNSISLASNRQWVFNPVNHDIYQQNIVYTGTQYDIDFSVTVDGNQEIQSACIGGSLIFNVFDPVTFTPWKNVDANGNNLYLSGSASANCSPDRNWNFEFSYLDATDRNKMVRFMDSIPNGYWVTVKDIPSYQQSVNKYAADWRADSSIYGVGNTIYDRLKSVGCTQIDSFYHPIAFLFIYKKNDPSFTPQQKFGQLLTDKITLESTCPGPAVRGTVSSPIFGPARQWSTLRWRGSELTNPATDSTGLVVVGIDTAGVATTLYSLDHSTQDLNISSIDPKHYPFIQLKLATTDTVHGKPYQLQSWRINYIPPPEGALAPNVLLKAPDTVVLGQPYEFAIAFKNVSPYSFDSMRVKLYIVDKGNAMHVINLPRMKPLVSGDTLTVDYKFDSKSFSGANTLYVAFNPANDQPEQYFFNNFLYKSFYVKGDSRNPNLDVTFDNVHILDEDIVSARPHIQIQLKSSSPYLLLSDTSLMNVQVKYPDGSLHSYHFNTDTLRFIPATAIGNNVATVEFTPAFTTQYNPTGDEYELIVSGKDALGNPAGLTPYRVSFKVINKPMISNMLNYPNPFTTSTAFVFTITGSEVPQNIKIQIMTITGKVVREITKEELGPLHIGRNITEFKWNGTDMYGQRLANGVYLYHVVTNLNGRSLTKYKAAGDNTDKFFNNGYGKMYLMK